MQHYEQSYTVWNDTRLLPAVGSECSDTEADPGWFSDAVSPHFDSCST